MGHIHVHIVDAPDGRRVLRLFKYGERGAATHVFDFEAARWVDLAAEHGIDGAIFPLEDHGT